MVMNSSDEDEDDVYTNAAARLKALKAIKPIVELATPDIEEIITEKPVIQPRIPSPIEIVDDLPVILRCPIHGTRSKRTKRSTRSSAEIINIRASPAITIDLDASTPSPSYINAINHGDSGNATEIIDCDVEEILTTNDDYMMDVKVRWRSREIERIKLGMNEKFSKIFQYFASQENVPENQIILTRKDTLINHADTPASVSLQIIDILDGGIVDTTYANNTEDTGPVCKIKIQSSSSTKHFLTYELGLTDSFSKLFEYCSKEKSIPVSKVKLFFDGEQVSPSDTPDSLDLDDEACFDLQIIE